nr:phorbol ester/diacylglycerol-binding protein unc-13 isoform X2 [Columba livia]
MNCSTSISQVEKSHLATGKERENVHQKVKKGRLDKAADTFKTYVVLKVQNVRSTTIDRRGSDPCWEQDFMFEIGADAKGFIIELWKKGLLWDSILGVLWIPLATVEHATDEGPGTWWTLHSEVIKKGSDIQGTKTPTSHEILLDVYFALPFEVPAVKRAVSFPADTHRDVGGRGWHGGARRSHRGARDGLLAAGSGLSVQESQLRRNKDQADGGNFAKARWARAIQKGSRRQPSVASSAWAQRSGCTLLPYESVVPVCH